MFKPRSQFVNVSWLLLLLCVAVCSHEHVCSYLSAFCVALSCVVVFCVHVGVFISGRCSGRCCDDSPLVAPLCDLQLPNPSLIQRKSWTYHAELDKLCIANIYFKKKKSVDSLMKWWHPVWVVGNFFYRLCNAYKLQQNLHFISRIHTFWGRN